MRTLLLIEPEPVADGGWFVRSALHLAGAPWASNVRITVRPGADAEYGQVAHTFSSRSLAKALTIDVGRLDAGAQTARALADSMQPLPARPARAQTRLLIEFLVRPDLPPGVEAQVAEIVVEGRVPGDDGLLELQTITMPILLSAELGGHTEPSVRRERLRAPLS
jgi:hypothetical protein